VKVDKNMISEKICKKIKLERNKKDLSQQELALRAGLDKNTIWKIETGQVSPTIVTLEKIAMALEIDFATLTDVTKVDL
jgi:transcriptional regulator with XRE-family HTH domain